MSDKTRSILGRLTEAQYLLLKKKVEDEPGMTIQKLVTTAVNAYIRGDFSIRPDGSYYIANPELIFEGDDAEAVDLDDLVGDPFESDRVETWGTRQIADYAERVTGRKVSIEMLRELIRQRYPQEISPGGRYLWETNDPTLREMLDEIEDGALERIRDERVKAFGGLK